MDDLVQRLIDSEEKYAQAVKAKAHVKSRLLSPQDDRKPGKKIMGGDRMAGMHQYAEHYAKELTRLLGRKPDGDLVIAEVGILKGTGLAVWCDLFPKAIVLGLDIDLS
jgi:hypothetical protein